MQYIINVFVDIYEILYRDILSVLYIIYTWKYLNIQFEVRNEILEWDFQCLQN